MRFRLVGRGVYFVDARDWKHALRAFAKRGDLPKDGARPGLWSWDAGQRDRWARVSSTPGAIARPVWRLAVAE